MVFLKKSELKPTGLSKEGLTMKTHIIRVNCPAGVDFLDGYLLDSSDANPEILLEELKNSLEVNPDRVFILQAWQWDEKSLEPKEELVAFLIAVFPKAVDYTYVLQVWAKPGISSVVTKKFFADRKSVV